MKSLRSVPVRLTIVFALLVALATAGFAHRFVHADSEMRAYLSAGGSYSDICDDGEGKAAAQTCDACRLVDSVSVPPAPASCAAPVGHLVVAAAPASPALTTVPVFDPVRPVRAPPVV